MLKSQQNDNVWLIGYHYGPTSPIPGLDYTYGFPDTTGFFSPFDMLAANASVCDSSGNLQLYTNGIFVANKYHHLLDSSADFNFDSIVSQLGFTQYFPFTESVIILPSPGHPAQYYLFHVSGNAFNNMTQAQPFRLAFSCVDMNINNGQGQMILKNQQVFADTLLYSTLQAVKHGNGRDWWIVIHEYNSNRFYSTLLTPNGIQSTINIGTGPAIDKGFTGQSSFSPDGTKYAMANKDSNLLYIYSFDRCVGTFKFEALVRHPFSTQLQNFTGCSFSPNSRYLYASDLLKLYQYDLYSSDITTSEKLIATFDGIGDPFQTYFAYHCPGPDNKIYLSTGNACQHLHVINSPDLPDTNCNFVQRQLKIIDYQSSLPTFPNYRLGPLSNSNCDSLYNIITSVEPSNRIISVYPNPSKNIFHFILIDKKDQLSSIVIKNTFGQIIYSGRETEINLSTYSAGLYFYSIKTKNGFDNNGRIVKE